MKKHKKIVNPHIKLKNKVTPSKAGHNKLAPAKPSKSVKKRSPRKHSHSKALHKISQKKLMNAMNHLSEQAEEVLQKYPLNIDGATATIEIVKGDQGIIYTLTVPKADIVTSSLLNEIRNELVSATTLSMKEIVDPEAFFEIKKRFIVEASNLLKKKIPSIEKNTEQLLVGILIKDMLGLGDIEFLVNDMNLEEIVIPDSKENIKVYSRKYGWLSTNVKVNKEEDIVNYSNIIARRVGRQITVLNPLLDAQLMTGDRANAILYPISTKGNTITIRKFSSDPMTIIDLINNHTCDMKSATLLWLAIENEMNILISGGTASGKTSILNALMPFIPPNHRVVSVEDTRELMLPEFLYWTPLVTRLPNPEGKGEVSMLDLLVNSLRMRPDRIILGEMRRQQEAMVLFEAMHTGHSVCATLHAESASETIQRLINPPLSVPANLLKAVNLNVVMYRDRTKGIRRIFQIAEFNAEGDTVTSNLLYRWIPEKDEIEVHGESSRFFEDLTRHSSMTSSQIKDNLKEKEKILGWLIDNHIRQLNPVGKTIQMYYTNKKKLMQMIQKNDTSLVI